MKVDKERARAILHAEAASSQDESISAHWASLVKSVVDACEDGSRTHIAALGTALLAKATNLRVDVFALKVKDGGKGAYSARNLAKEVLAAHAPMLGLDLGVTGREPLNNQPYFRYDRISPEMDVKASGKRGLLALCAVLEELERVDSEDEARSALRAFLALRRKEDPPELPGDASVPATGERLTSLIEEFVDENSEGGKRAQAVVAGLLGLPDGPEAVETGRVNDPDRHLPGDVGVRVDEGYRLVVEVRDKPVSVQDLMHFVAKAKAHRVPRALVVATATGQSNLRVGEAQVYARRMGVHLDVMTGWAGLVSAMLMQNRAPTVELMLGTAHKLVYERLVELEASALALAWWGRGSREA